MKINRRLVFMSFSIMLGIASGLGAYTFFYAKGISYLGNDPAACVNCHAMRPQFDGWIKASHRHVATCNDCHTPPNVLGKYVVKAINGFNHSLAFTTGRYPESIRINRMNQKVTEATCRNCHATLTHAIDRQKTMSCVFCHRNVGHMH